MAIIAFLENGDEVEINGPLLLAAEDGRISVSRDLFSCAQDGKYVKVHIDKLLKANFPDNSLIEVEEIMSSELPSVKNAWEKLRVHLKTS